MRIDIRDLDVGSDATGLDYNVFEGLVLLSVSAHNREHLDLNKMIFRRKVEKAHIEAERVLLEEMKLREVATPIEFVDVEEFTKQVQIEREAARLTWTEHLVEAADDQMNRY